MLKTILFLLGLFVPACMCGLGLAFAADLPGWWFWLTLLAFVVGPIVSIVAYISASRQSTASADVSGQPGPR